MPQIYIMAAITLVLAVIFERMRRATRGPNHDQSGNEVVYWERQATRERELRDALQSPRVQKGR